MPSAHNQLAAYRAAMGYETTMRQLAADGRDEDGTCKRCAAPLAVKHRDGCPQTRRVMVERVNAPQSAV